MKIKNITFTQHNEANVTASFDIHKNDGTLLLRVENRGLTSTASTIAAAKAEIRQSARNIRDSYQSMKASKLAAALADFAAQPDVDIEA